MAGLPSMDSILLPYSPKEDHQDYMLMVFFFLNLSKWIYMLSIIQKAKVVSKKY